MRKHPLAPRTPKLMASVAVGAAILTAVTAILPPGDLASDSTTLHVAIDTAVSVIALIASFLLLGRFRGTRSLNDLLLVGAFVLFLLTNVGFALVAALVDFLPERFEIWSSAAGRLSASAVLTAAAFWPARRVSAPRSAAVYMLSGCFVLLAAIGAAVALLQDVIPPGVRLAPAASGASGLPLVASPGLLGAQLATALLLGAASIAFMRRALHTADQLMHWIACASVLSAFAFLNYFLLPSLYTDWVTLGDVLRAAAWICLLLGGLAEIGVYRQHAAVSAQLEERERIARELHDGLAQDLAFIAARLRELATRRQRERSDDSELLSMLASAARRALDESRVSVWALAKPAMRLDIAVERAVEEVAEREGGRVLVEAEPVSEVSEEAKQTVLRIAREAVTNAIRHGHPRTVEVRLAAADGLRLSVKDDGQGFDAVRPGGLGLDTMRQRASACGGDLEIASRPGEGTVVVASFPEEALSSQAAARFPWERRSTTESAGPEATGLATLKS